MAKLKIQPAQISDAVLLAADLRAADVQELHAMHGDWADLEEVIADGISRSIETCWTAFEDDQIIMIGGAAPGPKSLVANGFGIPWLLASNAFDDRGVMLTKTTRRHMVALLKKYQFLANYVDARHERSIAWLKRLGFVVSEGTYPAGAYGLPFHSFWMGSYV